MSLSQLCILIIRLKKNTDNKNVKYFEPNAIEIENIYS